MNPSNKRYRIKRIDDHEIPLFKLQTQNLKINEGKLGWSNWLDTGKQVRVLAENKYQEKITAQKKLGKKAPVV